MGWEKGRYYTCTKRVDGKVVREYFGCGPEAQRAAQEDIEARDRRRNQQLEEQIGIDLSQRTQSHAKENPPENNGPPPIGVPAPAMSQWLNAAPPPATTMRTPVDP